jgi:gas vesicle protein
MTDTDQHIEQLRAEAAARRQSIATDLELMGDRVSPSRIAERRKARMRERMQGVRNTVFGVSERPSRTHAAYGYPQTYGESYPRTSGEMYSSTSGSLPSSGDSSSSLADKAGGAVSTLKEHAPDSLGAATEGNPLAAGIVGFGIGMLAATLLPSSPDEQRAARKLQPKLEDAGRALGQTGKEAAEHVKPEVQQAVEDVKGSAQESVQNVKSEAQSKVESVKDTAQTKTEEVRSQA